MSTLKDIKGYWNVGYSYDFNDVNMWEGQILLEEDGWFEGIVVDPKSSYTEDRFIFGVYHPDKVIELFKLTPINISSFFVFHGKKSEKGYDGDFDVIELLGAVPYGASRINTKDFELTRENKDEKIEELKSRIQNYKDNIMDETEKELYNNTTAMRHRMCQIILRNYEGDAFSSEEKEQIMEDFQPISDRVMQDVTEEAKSLVKKMLNSLPDDDDDLPF